MLTTISSSCFHILHVVSRKKRQYLQVNAIIDLRTVGGARVKKTMFQLACLLYILCGGYLLSATYYFERFALVPFIMPMLYFALTLALAIVIYRKIGQNVQITLLLFLLAVALSYIGFVPAQMGDGFAYLLYNTVSLLSVSFLAHFLVHYFALLGISWPYIGSLKFFYSFPSLAFVCSFGAFIVPSVTPIVDWVTILLFANGLINILAILLIGYKRSHAKQLKWLVFICITPFLPFILGYIIPTLLKLTPVLSAEVAALFFIVIPISFITFQMTERLFGLQQYISRLRYFGLLTITSSLLLTAVVYMLTSLHIHTSILFFCISCCVMFALLFIKEQLDFSKRKKLQIKREVDEKAILLALQSATSKQQLFIKLKQLMQKYLQLEHVEIIVNTRPQFELHYDNGVYEIGIQEHVTLQIGKSGQVLQLLHEEIRLIEIVAPFVNALLQNFDNLENMVASQPLSSSVERLAWQLVEGEKRQLAQELHDTILQEQLQLVRQLDVGNDMKTIREQLLDLNFELREFCETLHPPLLDAIGLEAALQKLVQKTKLRANFELSLTIQLTKLENDALSLMLYRTVQELLTNAIKHSNASTVSIVLTVFDEHYTLTYEDNGVGYEETNATSFGLTGIQQRHEIFGGVVRKMRGNGTNYIISNRKEHIDAYTRR